MKPHVLIPWSGGLDSTYAIYDHLSRGVAVKAFHVHLENNEFKMKREAEAIKKLLELFEKRFGDDILFYNENSSVCMGSVDYGTIKNAQPPLWVQHAVYQVTPTTTEVVVSYVLGDDAISYLDDIRKMYYSYQPFVWHLLPEINFKYSRKSKFDILDELPSLWYKHVTFCDDGYGQTIPCGKCHPCIKMREAESYDHRTGVHKHFFDWTDIHLGSRDIPYALETAIDDVTRGNINAVCEFNKLIKNNDVIESPKT